MKKWYTLVLMLVFLTVPLMAQQQQADSTQLTPMQTQQPAKQKKQEPSKVFYGGSIGLSFGDYFRINVAPMVGYKVSKQISVGGKVAYEYIEDKRYEPKITSSNYGGSAFARYRAIPQLYFHGEFAYMSYKYKTSNIETDRQWVPFLLLGGGYIQRISPKTSIYAEVLFDVLQDSKSPYDDWTPFFSIGVGVGL